MLAPPVPPRIFSGVQPTGELHLGNYLGALRQWVALQDEGTHDAIYSVVDAHALTVDYRPEEMRPRVVTTAIGCLAAGVDPERSTLMVQSEVPRHMELAWYLATVTPMGALGRMTQFKEKSEQHRQNVNAGLFTYPVLMAADILIYRATLVPVGHDQTQHLELAREIVRHFQHRFESSLLLEPLPHPLKLRIRGTDGHEKMSKSRGNTIGMLESPEAMWKKLKGAFTDPQRVTRDIPGRPEVCNIFTMHGAVTAPEEVQAIERDCRSAALGCGDCKKLLHESLTSALAPVRERAAELTARPGRVLEVLGDGAARCRRLADETMEAAREVMGLARPGA